jgi:lysozyme
VPVAAGVRAISGGKLHVDDCALSGAKLRYPDGWSRTSRGNRMTNGNQTYGIDVSHYDLAIDWDTAVNDPGNPKINFCYVKASQLHKYADPNTPPQCPDAYFATNWAALQRLQIPKGAYFYCEPYFTAQQMADEFFAHYVPQHGDLPPSLDVEDEYLQSISSGKCTAQQNVQQILDFAALVSAKIWGAKPLIYIRDDICEALGSPQQFKPYPLWIVEYDVPEPKIPVPWASYTFWQYNDCDNRAGFPVPNNCDVDWFNGPAANLKNLFI